ncbi:MAG: GC-type dockerin domain-anchored protein [Planctomycetota bacterium]
MKTERHGQRRTGRPAIAAIALAGLATSALAIDDYDTEEWPVILQWFETPWSQMERRAQDVFVSGYGGMWMPNPTRGDSDGSTGYDPLDRFDFGGPGFSLSTAFGTQDTWTAMVEQMSGFDLQIYPDAILNHNSGRNGSAFRQQQGGWPGFWMNPDDPPVDKGVGDDWGDFRDGGGSGDIFGDLVGLIDIAHETNFQFIRQPVSAGDPNNIPAGTLYNIPNADNIKFYPDDDATGRSVTNPGTSRHPGTSNFTWYPWNADDPSTGDPVLENATGYLMRWARWMIEVQGADGFRLDAAKHVESFFWDTFYDSALHEARITPDGRRVNPFSFGESVSSNQFIFDNYVRRDAFAFRDTLDVSGAGDMRNLLNNPFGTSWQTVLNSHIDNTNDGFNNGNLGVNHIFSHDNGTVGDGSQPPVPNHKQQGWPFHAYLLMRPGPAIVYLNHFAIARPANGFWPRSGTNTALGFDPDPNQNGVLEVAEAVENTLVTDLVNLRTQYARGQFRPLNFTDFTNPSLDDVIVFERTTPIQNGGATWPDDYSSNVLTAVNKRYDSGIDVRNVRTSFPVGTRLHELTGNAMDPVVDPTDAIPDVITVGASQRVTISIPRNNTGGTETNRGYVVYGPALPTGAVTLTEGGAPLGTLPADPTATPWGLRRQHDVQVVTGDSFTIQLDTDTGDALDPFAQDDDAVFRIDAGYFDWNSDGSVDHDNTAGRDRAGFENFNDVRLPAIVSGGTTGQYRQTIDATQLDDGYHYLTVRAFRARNPAEGEIWREFRIPIYVDQAGPVIELEDPGAIAGPQETFRVFVDPTATEVHMFWNLSAAFDPLDETDIFTRATQFDRYTFDKNLDIGTAGCGELTVVAYERSGNASVTRVQIGGCNGDVTTDGTGNGIPDCQITLSDFSYYLNRWAGNFPDADITTTGVCDYGNGGDGIDLSDFSCYLSTWAGGCP